MKRSALGVAALALGLAVATSAAWAQEPTTTTTRPVTFGVSGGLSLPTGDLNTGAKVGFNINGLVEGRPAGYPVGLRGEFLWDQFGLDGADGNFRILGGIANVIYRFAIASGTPVTPYVIGGVGVYNFRQKIDNVAFDSQIGTFTDSQTKFGLNGGAGVEFLLSGFSTFAEARFHTIFTEGSNANLIPVTFGVRF